MRATRDHGYELLLPNERCRDLSSLSPWLGESPVATRCSRTSLGLPRPHSEFATIVSNPRSLGCRGITLTREKARIPDKSGEPDGLMKVRRGVSLPVQDINSSNEWYVILKCRNFRSRETHSFLDWKYVTPGLEIFFSNQKRLHTRNGFQVRYGNLVFQPGAISHQKQASLPVSESSFLTENALLPEVRHVGFDIFVFDKKRLQK